MIEKNDKTTLVELPTVEISRHRRLSLIWVIPIIAFIIALWLVYTHFVDKGESISIQFTDGSGLIAGKTELKYQGVRVGLVQDIHLSDDMANVVVEAQLMKSAVGLAKTGSKFWVVRPEIGISRISGLNTLFTGPYISIRAGKGKPETTFIGLDDAPIVNVDRPGLNLILEAAQLGSLNVGSPVYYREYKVGEIDTIGLSADARTVQIAIHIEPPYVELVHENTKFWNTSGIGFSLGLFGAKIETESLDALLRGGIAFATPPNDAMGNRVSDKSVFKLYNASKDEWLKWRPSLPVGNSVNSQIDLQRVERDNTPERFNLVGPPTHYQ